MKLLDQLGLRSPAFAALALAFAAIGDAFLYPFLPINYESFGIPIAWVGLLLSINRWVRIFSNSLTVRLFEKYGIRSVMIIAVIFAISSTLGYGIATNLILWMLFRVMWGLAFSAMRIGTLGYALQHQKKGIALGVSRSFQELGPMLALFIAPVLVRHVEPRGVFFMLALCSLPALYFVLALPPAATNEIQAIRTKRFIHWPSTLNSITLVAAILIDGIVVVVLGILFLNYRDNISAGAATALAAFYLGYRRLCLFALSPAGGWIADKIGLDSVFNISMILVVIGLAIMLTGWIAAGAIVVFTFYSINAAVTPGSVSSKNIHSLAAVAENATWRDIGAAIGTVLGGLLISSSNLHTVLMIATFALSTLLVVHIGTPRKTLKLFYLWK